MNFLYGFIIGAIVASVVEFLVWNNNKAKFLAAAEKAATEIAELKTKAADLEAKIK
jgi:biotin transporter BioY